MNTILSPIRLLNEYWENNSQNLVRILIILFVLSLSLLFGLKFSPNRLSLVIILIGGIIGGIVLLQWPPIGLAIATFVGLIISYSGPGNVNVSIFLAGLLIFLWFLDIAVRKREFQLISSKTTVPIFSFIAVCLLSMGMGQLPWFSFAKSAPIDAQAGGFTLFVLSAGIFLLAANQIKDIVWLKVITWVFLGFSFIFVSNWLLLLFTPLSKDIFEVPTSVFWLWIIALAAGQVVFNQDLNFFSKAALGSLIAGVLYILFIQLFSWKSGWLPVAVALGIILLLRSWKIALILVPIGIFAVIIFSPEVLLTEDYSLSTRVEAWVILGEIIKVNPVLGLGFANYYWYTPLFPIRGWYVQFNSHNNYIDIIAQTGLLGLLCLFWFFWEVGKVGWSLRDHLSDGFSRGYVYGSLAGLGGMLVASMLGDWVLPFVYNVGMNGFRTSLLGWLFLGGVVAVEQIQKKKMEDAQLIG